MAGLIWIERRFDRKSRHFYRVVLVNGAWAASFWKLSEAVEAAKKLAQKHGLAFRSAVVLPFVKGGAE